MRILYCVVAIVAAQRVLELCLASTNTRRLRAQGAVEIDARGYPWLVALHAGWLAAIVLLVPPDAAPCWSWLTLFGLLQAGRLWVIGSLGRRWTTRIMVLHGAPRIERGPYRFLNHPNYVIVMAAIVVLPLAFGAVALALLFAAANLMLLARRIAIEDCALASLSAAPARVSPAPRPRGSVRRDGPDAAAALAVAGPRRPAAAAGAAAGVRKRRRPE